MKDEHHEARDRINRDRAIALDRAFVAGRLLDEKYYPKVMEAIKRGEKGFGIFREVCNEAGIPEDEQEPLRKAVYAYAATAKAPWAPC